MYVIFPTKLEVFRIHRPEMVRCQSKIFLTLINFLVYIHQAYNFLKTLPQS